jgi:alpha-tubulin suppressor-like RCC1 family protein
VRCDVCREAPYRLADGTTRARPHGYDTQRVTRIFLLTSMRCRWRSTAPLLVALGALLGVGTTALAGPAPGSPGRGSLAAGTGHACVVASGAAYCWGLNYAGQLGDGSSDGPRSCAVAHVSARVSCSASAVRVDVVAGIRSIAAGDGFTCAVLRSGDVYCWGMNYDGALGDGSIAGPQTCRVGSHSFSCSSSAVRVSGLNRAVGISATADHVCAVVADGSVYCWGANEEGDLGTGRLTSSRVCGAEPPAEPCSPTPHRVTGLDAATAVAAGVDHTCALLRDGGVDCWGENALGELGAGDVRLPSCQGDPCSTRPLRVRTLHSAVAVSAGDEQSCALLADGDVDCWGDNEDGELGQGSTSGPQTCHIPQAVPCSDLPVRVVGVAHASAVATGNGQACAASLGQVFCWGMTSWGVLGNGTTHSQSACWNGACDTRPVRVVEVAGADAVAASGGGLDGCALSAPLAVSCWGAGANTGDFGGGNALSSASPLPVSGLPG